MKETEVASFIISVCRPRKRRKSPAGLALFALAGVKPHKENTIEERTAEARRHLSEDIHYFSGVMSVLPALGIKRASQYWNEGEKILNAAERFSNKCSQSS